MTPEPLTDIAARDSPVWRGRPAFLVRCPVLDPGHFAGCAELAPADAVLPVENERGVGFALSDSLFLRSTFLRHVGPRFFGVEAQAPAAAEDTVVALRQHSELGPGRLIQRFDGVPRFDHEVEPNAGHGTSLSSRTSGGSGAVTVGRIGQRAIHRRHRWPPLGTAGRYSPLALTNEIKGVVLPKLPGDVVVVWSSGRVAGSGPVRPDNSAGARPVFRRRWCVPDRTGGTRRADAVMTRELAASPSGRRGPGRLRQHLNRRLS